jgi:tRNAThr (cytosine32-N3)-methyltransferase
LLDPAYPGLYIRGDGTRVYFFPKTELEGLVTAPLRGEEEGAMFKIEDSGEDRRMVSPGASDACTGKADFDSW